MSVPSDLRPFLCQTATDKDNKAATAKEKPAPEAQAAHATLQKPQPKPLHLFTGLLAAFFTLLMLPACEMQQNIEVELPGHEPVTLIECYLEPGQPARLLATRSVSFFDSAEFKTEDELQVSLYENGRLYRFDHRYEIDSFYLTIFNYISADSITYSENSNWELVVRNQDEEIARASARFLPKPSIRQIEYQVDTDSLLSLQIQVADDPASKNYYRLRIYSSDMLPHNGFSGLWNDLNASGGMLKINTGRALKIGSEKVIVSLYHIEEEYYNFLRSIQKAHDANYNPFAQPANLESNLNGKAIGIFTAVSGQTDTLHVELQ